MLANPMFRLTLGLCLCLHAIGLGLAETPDGGDRAAVLKVLADGERTDYALDGEMVRDDLLSDLEGLVGKKGRSVCLVVLFHRNTSIATVLNVVGTATKAGIARLRYLCYTDDAHKPFEITLGGGISLTRVIEEENSIR